ncbi:hypothetical protein BH23GEM6_BH23GEM6_09360 [soil metagenome]
MHTPDAAPPAEPAAALWEDFLDIYYAPRQVFARRTDGRWAPVLLLLTLLMALLFYASFSVLAPVFEAEFNRAMQQNPGISAEQLDQARRMAGIFGLVSAVFAFPLGVIITGAVVWAVGKLFDSVAPFAAGLLIATYAQFPRLLQQLTSILQGLVLDTRDLRSIYSVSLSPARFLDPDSVSVLLMGFAGRFDLFILWSSLLIAIGLQVLGRVPKLHSYLAAALVWLLGSFPVLLGALGG